MVDHEAEDRNSGEHRDDGDDDRRAPAQAHQDRGERGQVSPQRHVGADPVPQDGAPDDEGNGRRDQEQAGHDHARLGPHPVDHVVGGPRRLEGGRLQRRDHRAGHEHDGWQDGDERDQRAQGLDARTGIHLGTSGRIGSGVGEDRAADDVGQQAR